MNLLFFTLVALGVAAIWLRHSVVQLLDSCRRRREQRQADLKVGLDTEPQYGPRFRVYSRESHPHLRVIVRIDTRDAEAEKASCA